MPEHAGPRFASLLRAWPPLGWLGDRWSDQRQALVVYPRPKHGALLRRPNGEVGDQQVAMSIEGRKQRVVVGSWVLEISGPPRCRQGAGPKPGWRPSVSR